MKHINLLTFLGAFSLLLAACGGEESTPVANVDLANPASVYCEDNGGTLELRSDNEGNVNGVCIFADGSECDEWAFFRGECGPGGADAPAAATQAETTGVSPTAFPTLMPIDAAAYESWWTYTHPDYGFSLLLPEDWVEMCLSGQTSCRSIRSDCWNSSSKLSVEPSGRGMKSGQKDTFQS